MSHLCRLRTGFGIKVGSEDDVKGSDGVRVRHQLQRRTGGIRLRDRPDRPVAAGTMLTRLATTLHMPVTLRLSFLYAVAFGGFVAFSVYLPTYLTTAYHLERGDAALRTAGFVVLAVAMRPIGGWLSDRFNPIAVLLSAYGAAALLALIAAFEFPLVPVGHGSLPRACRGPGHRHRGGLRAPRPPRRIRTGRAVTGVVRAAGRLGGFFPLVMGLIYGALGNYMVGSCCSPRPRPRAAGVFTAIVVRRRAEQMAAAGTPAANR
jgi:NNP family nitrate/nitrite transporter-like MFS transporter